MRTRLAIWTMMLAAPAVWAQQQQDKIVQKILDVKYADPSHVADAVRIFGVNVNFDRNMHVISVRGSAESVAAVEDALKKLDVAPVNVELTVFLISGMGGAKAPAADEGVGSELAPTVKQLHALFPYKSYRVSETFVLRGRDGRDGSTSGILPPSNSTYRFSYNSASVSAGAPRVVHIDKLNLTVSTATGYRDKDGKEITRNVGFGTDIDVSEGQKVVVGKSNINGGAEDAMILVVTAKVVQ